MTIHSYITSSQDLPDSPIRKVIIHTDSIGRHAWVGCLSPSVCLFVRSITNDPQILPTIDHPPTHRLPTGLQPDCLHGLRTTLRYV